MKVASCHNNTDNETNTTATIPCLHKSFLPEYNQYTLFSPCCFLNLLHLYELKETFNDCLNHMRTH